MDARGGKGANLNLVDLSTTLLDFAASLWTRGRIGRFCSVIRRLGDPRGWHGYHPELGGPQHQLVSHGGIFMDPWAYWALP